MARHVSELTDRWRDGIGSNIKNFNTWQALNLRNFQNINYILTVSETFLGFGYFLD
jgi:hypothetical protein